MRLRLLLLLHPTTINITYWQPHMRRAGVVEKVARRSKQTAFAFS
jgi:hypothetical protein